jgi:hypothetical protein
MPEGNGADLLQWMRNYGVNIPIITFSGIPQNNEIMISLGATHKFEKCQVLTGAADQLILSLLA